ncbi:MAG: CRISPR-associated endonuclease Cas2 [Geminicoccaceae bacterium]|nr:CRISPR-associated endonuclease Cas2 [Geminicoccaceae bacterium]MCS7269300.1 CRISPR-associated endonuclease Cas2 [Geminicoccaceae bacterium]
MNEEHLFVVAYDIADPKRWRRVYGLLLGYGAWLQLSVFQCRLDRKRLVQLEASLRERIHAREDHVLLLDLGPADRVQVRVRSLGKTFEPVRREPVIV